jgi:hypothetical protein
MAFNELTQESFARTVGVEICSINEVSSCLTVGFIDLLRIILRRSSSPIVAEGHSPQSRFGNPEAALAQ